MELSPRSARILAYFVDYTVIAAPITIFALLLLGENWDMKFENRSFVIVWFSILIGIMMLFLFCKDIFGGASFGKRIFGIGIRGVTDDSTPNTGKLVLRNVPLLLLPIEAFLMIFSSDYSRIGDRITNTQVVKLQDRTWTKKLVISVPIIFVVMTSFVYGLQFSMSRTAAFEVAKEFTLSNEKIKEKVGEIRDVGKFPVANIAMNGGYGSANFLIDIAGDDWEGKSSVLMRKKPGGDWVVTGGNWGINPK